MAQTPPALVDVSPIIGTPTRAPTACPDPADSTGRGVRRTAPANPAGPPLVDELLGRAPNEACAHELRRVTRLSDRTMNHHLEQLLGAGPATGQRGRIDGCERSAPGAVEAVSRALAGVRR